jgi:hypothetical protein
MSFIFLLDIAGLGVRASLLAPRFSGTIVNFQDSNTETQTASCPDGI